MITSIPEYYQTFVDIQPDFMVFPDPTRRLPTVMDYLVKDDRIKAITNEISQLSPKALEERKQLLEICFEGVHNYETHLLDLFEKYFGEDSPLSSCPNDVKIAAAGAVSQAFPYEGVASFNPGITTHPDQSGLAQGCVRVVLSVRSYGEFHRSSLSFRTGIIDEKGFLSLDEPKRTQDGVTTTCLPRVDGTSFVFPDGYNLNNAVIYGPFMSDVGETWEDFRFTKFQDEGEYEGAYLGTFTSFNCTAQRLQPSLILTRDFKTFDYHLFRGACAEDKDMAFFPKKINGRYTLLSRNDGRDMYIMSSEDLVSWKKKKKLAESRPELFDAHKIGVCAPPIETPSGWLVIYHGVADPGQIYSLSAMLLDLEAPDKVIARLPYTIHHPFADEKYGMLTTINFTCGAMVHQPSGALVMPYACNDSHWKVARMDLCALVARLLDDGKV